MAQKKQGQSHDHYTWSRGFFQFGGEDDRYEDDAFMERVMDHTEDYLRTDQWEWLSSRLHDLQRVIDTTPYTLSQIEQDRQTLQRQQEAIEQEEQRKVERELGYKRQQLERERRRDGWPTNSFRA